MMWSKCFSLQLRARMANALILAILGCYSSLASGHHSFAVHFEGERTITVSGIVTEFRFRNPHGTIVIDAADAGQDSQIWRIETNSPNILRRRGWSAESISVGDAVSITGYPARDGSNSMRVYRVEFADGHELIGQRPAAGVER